MTLNSKGRMTQQPLAFPFHLPARSCVYQKRMVNYPLSVTAAIEVGVEFAKTLWQKTTPAAALDLG
jgi:hypothetical protein